MAESNRFLRRVPLAGLKGQARNRNRRASVPLTEDHFRSRIPRLIETDFYSRIEKCRARPRCPLSHAQRTGKAVCGLEMKLNLILKKTDVRNNRNCVSKAFTDLFSDDDSVDLVLFANRL